MATSVYKINKGINKPIEFKGLKAQYIWHLGGGLLVLLVLFAALYILGLHSFLCVVVIGALGSLLFYLVYRASHRYGEHSLMKKMARRAIPRAIRSHSRKPFLKP